MVEETMDAAVVDDDRVTVACDGGDQSGRCG